MPQESKFKKKTEINTKIIKVTEACNFVYHSTLGSGAFGKIRKCIPKQKLFQIIPEDMLSSPSKEDMVSIKGMHKDHSADTTKTTDTDTLMQEQDSAPSEENTLTYWANEDIIKAATKACDECQAVKL